MTPERQARLKAVLAKRQPDLTVVTDFVHKSRNLAAIVRSCDSVGIMQVHAVVDEENYRTYRGTAASAQRWVEVVRHPSLVPALTGLKFQGYQLVAAHLTDKARDYREVDYTKPTAIVIGAEIAGVSEDAFALMDSCVTVPMLGMVESLNVSVAAATLLAEARQQRERAGLYNTCRLDGTTYKHWLFAWSQPRLKQFCDQRGLSYPPIDDDGELVNPSQWYADVRALTGEDPQ